MGFVIFFHIIISILLIISILMQSSKGGGLAGMMGGDSMGAAFGGRGAATFLSRVTTILGLVFALSCIGQIMLSKTIYGGQRSIIQEELTTPQPTTPATSLPGLPEATTSQPETTPVVPDTTK